MSVDIEVESRASSQEQVKAPESASDALTRPDAPKTPKTPNINDAFDDIRKSLSHIPKEPGPTDGAKNYKHYLYGHPKED